VIKRERARDRGGDETVRGVHNLADAEAKAHEEDTASLSRTWKLGCRVYS